MSRRTYQPRDESRIFFFDRLERPGAFGRGVFVAQHAGLKIMRDGRIEISANRVGNLRNVFARGFIPLLCPDGHLQDIALAVRIWTAF
jgi:hypothetical protein